MSIKITIFTFLLFIKSVYNKIKTPPNRWGKKGAWGEEGVNINNYQNNIQ